ncbi:MAG TPA: hypothetical protein VHL57_05890 [Flavobacteriales bacterium]|jgi:hypothetical protein|nr:hypothetical protein [Flavobacteriales bacterium]
MRPVLVIAFALWALAACAQREKFVRYNLLVGRAEWCSTTGDHSAALQAYDSAFALIPFMGRDHFFAAKTALQAGRDDRANAILIEGVENGLPLRQYYDSTVQAFLLSERAMPLLNTWDLMEQRYWSRADTALIRALRTIGDGNRTVEDAQGGARMERDTLAFETFVALVEQRGFPTALAVGDAIYLPQRLFREQLIDYPNDPRWRRVLPHIQRAINTGALPPDYLCPFQDLADLARGRPLTYGALFRWMRSEKAITLAPRKRLDKARAAVGLLPIAQALVVEGMDASQVVFAEGP